ncbi:hypothetical protein SAMD00024442_34_6 [Candidatus Symbiothrix dinenymphae]|nr:hypothetical protein SAMD00024442_34_6 [Candidatus Symbiothrix dinenymphae]
METIRNRFIIVVLGVATVAMAQPSQQSQPSPSSQPSQLLQHEFSLVVGGGLSSLHYTPTVGDASLGLGGFAGLGYTFRFSEHWGVGTGLEAALFNGNYSLASLSDHYPSYDGEENFEYHYTIEGYRDRQQAILLNIPLMLHFQTGRYYAALGGKVGIPMSATFNNSAKLNAWGNYPPSSLHLEDPPFSGFGSYTVSNKGDLALKTAFFASTEVGVRWQLSNGWSLSTGLYADYGLNNIRPTATASLIDYPDYLVSDNYRPNSVVASTNAGKPLADKLNPLAAGIKIGLHFGIPSSNAPDNAPKASKTPPENDRTFRTPIPMILPAKVKAPPAATVAFATPALKPMPKNIERKKEKKVVLPNVPYTNHKISDHFMFEPGSLQLDRTFAKNDSVLEKLKATIATLDDDTTVVITGIQLSSYSSPDGPFALNKRIADDRARVWKQFLIVEMAKFELGDDIFTTNAVGEDWEELTRLVKIGNWKDKPQILKIISTTASPDAREKALMKLRDGTPFKQIKEELYPQLRRVEYTINYKMKVQKK